MCGFAGFYIKKSQGRIGLPSLLDRMGSSIHHRGPDQTGHWSDLQRGLGVVHKRLSILDLSNAGKQPMFSHDKRYILAYNGEIYNYKELKQCLIASGREFQSSSDTEVLLALIEHFTLNEALQKIRGMFAFSLFDLASNSLYLVRDRVGEKPLYYSLVDGSCIFASEMKPFSFFPGWKKIINQDSLKHQLEFGYVPEPHTIYANTYKVPPGNIIEINLSHGAKIVKESPYWAIQRQLNSSHSSCKDYNSVKSTLEHTLRDAVASQLVADVPVGVFLSGGVDSSLITALANQESSLSLNSFTIRFKEQGYDESVFAEDIAKHVNTVHNTTTFSHDDALSIVMDLPKIYDEPFSDPSQLPMILLAKTARQKVKVCLSGDGADELFIGYSRYFLVKEMWRIISLLSPMGRNFVQSSMQSFSSAWLQVQKVLESKKYVFSDKLYKLSTLFGEQSMQDFYLKYCSHSKGNLSYFNINRDELRLPNSYSSLNILEQLSLLDFRNYLPGDILVKLDRAAMAASLETRAPFLDHRVVELSQTIPLFMKNQRSSGKKILKDILSQYVPKQLTDRPKKGFSVPIAGWIRGALQKEVASSLLLGESMEDVNNYIDCRKVRNMWREHMSGYRNWERVLWNWYIFIKWKIETGATLDELEPEVVLQNTC